jgi:hypothetical protein
LRTIPIYFDTCSKYGGRCFFVAWDGQKEEQGTAETKVPAKAKWGVFAGAQNDNLKTYNAIATVGLVSGSIAFNGR